VPDGIKEEVKKKFNNYVRNIVALLQQQQQKEINFINNKIK
jgi:hypothetical protein